MTGKTQTRSELLAKIARLRADKERLEQALDEIGTIVNEEIGEEDQEVDSGDDATEDLEEED